MNIVDVILYLTELISRTIKCYKTYINFDLVK